MTPPSAVRFMGRDVCVVAVQGMADEGAAGRYTHFGTLVEFDPGQSPIDLRDTLLHEHLHMVSSFLDLKLSERQVLLLSTSLIALFDDNPEFAEFITNKAA